jgi:urocanate hydratase
VRDWSLDCTTRCIASSAAACAGITIGADVMRHANAGYEIARACAKEQGVKLPMT